MRRIWLVLFFILTNSIFAVAQDTDFAPIYIADGYDVPIGTVSERHSVAAWSGSWRSAWTFGLAENIGGTLHYDSGMTLYGNNPHETTAYAAASGIVVFTHSATRWQGMVIIQHDPLYRNDGQRYFTRYRYLHHVTVNIGERVERGQAIASIDGILGFDVSSTSILADSPLHYPFDNQAELLSHYINPREFINGHRPRQPQRTTRFASPTNGIPAQGFFDEHPGIDLDTPIGQVIFAATEGVVIWVGDCANCQLISQRVYPCNASYQQDANWGYGYGTFVVVRYAAVLMPPPVRDLIARYSVAQDYVYVLYAHLAQVDVEYGTTVEASTRLGLTGQTGCTSAPALHVEVRIGHDEAINGIWLQQDAINPSLIFDF
jgi:murein DD-endopeptidase MepM/ murein hydrolase activator NlpD